MLGLPPIDRSFVFRAHDRERALRLFQRAEMNDDFAWVVAEAGEHNPLVIDDRSVASFVAGSAPQQSRIDDDIELVTSLARRFAGRLRLLEERALAFFADDAVRRTLRDEARHANVAVTDRGITSARGGFMRGRDVAACIDALAGVVDRVTAAAAHGRTVPLREARRLQSSRRVARGCLECTRNRMDHPLSIGSAP